MHQAWSGTAQPDEIFGALPRFLREALACLTEAERQALEELRLREGFCLSAVSGGREWSHPTWRTHVLTGEDLSRVLETVGQGSVHTVLDQVQNGYLTGAGGLRVGVCGQGAVQEGRLLSFRPVTSLAIRLPHPITGVAGPLLPALLNHGKLESTLILSPPGLGKTTLLRDLIRCISQGEGLSPLRVGVADERGELGGGALRYFLGPRTDVLAHCPKAQALMMLLRGMNPQVLAADEITAPADLTAMEEATGCGTVLLATAHGDGLRALQQRPLYRRLITENLFRRFVCLTWQNGRRHYAVHTAEQVPIGEGAL